jgi:hypothetical protein
LLLKPDRGQRIIERRSDHGYPRYHRAVARLLRTDPVDQLPWHRVVGAGGEIRLRGAAAQRARLKLEGVQFNGKRVDMDHFEHSIKPWENLQVAESQQHAPVQDEDSWNGGAQKRRLFIT